MKSSSNDDTHLKRLRWRCSRRGMLELDEILVDFFDQHFLGLTPKEQVTFERLLEEPDPDLLAWLMHNAQPRDPDFVTMVEKITTLRGQNV